MDGEAKESADDQENRSIRVTKDDLQKAWDNAVKMVHRENEEEECPLRRMSGKERIAAIRERRQLWQRNEQMKLCTLGERKQRIEAKWVVGKCKNDYESTVIPATEVPQAQSSVGVVAPTHKKE